MTTDQPPRERVHLLGSLLRVLSMLVILGFGIWGGLALFYQFPAVVWLRATAAALWAVLSLVALIVYIRRRSRLIVLIYPAMLAALLFWWDNIPASSSRDWAEEVARTTAAVVNGPEVTLANVRNFDWRTATDYTPRWENRTYDLEKLTSVDLILPNEAIPAIAHPLISFGFDDGTYVTFSNEIRWEKNESVSEIGTLFKQYEAIVIAADERDSIRLRTNIRGQTVRLYRINMPKPAMRSLFMTYIEQANSVTETPRFYNTLTTDYTDITTELVSRIVTDAPLDYRLWFSATLPASIADLNGLMPGFTLDELRNGGTISGRAQAVNTAPGFSSRIRAGVPGIAPLIRS
ncbi:Lnb N-terminal periplasmic domain-containing protein [Pararhizobium sp. O133]|uniref:Lnb N-terminal periplasmic domain-containing protein n=1 Tax=Pararhizobium sp. O133 TaxID=3449278 RepID=UPI003F68301D